MQLQHFLSWNKTNIKYSCKLQLYMAKGWYHSEPRDQRISYQSTALHLQYNNFLEIVQIENEKNYKTTIKPRKQKLDIDFFFLVENYILFVN